MADPSIPISRRNKKTTQRRITFVEACKILIKQGLPFADARWTLIVAIINRNVFTWGRSKLKGHPKYTPLHLIAPRAWMGLVIDSDRNQLISPTLARRELPRTARQEPLGDISQIDLSAVERIIEVRLDRTTVEMLARGEGPPAPPQMRCLSDAEKNNAAIWGNSAFYLAELASKYLQRHGVRQRERARKPRRGPIPGTIARFVKADRALYPEIDRLVHEDHMSVGEAIRSIDPTKLEGRGIIESRVRRIAKLYKEDHGLA
jgi:hypothetical protein